MAKQLWLLPLQLAWRHGRWHRPSIHRAHSNIHEEVSKLDRVVGVSKSATQASNDSNDELESSPTPPQGMNM
jgi:hypothetical protein